jgi:hypothetical protein
MPQFFVPLALVITSIGIFVVYTNPTYQGTKSIQNQVAAYDDALTKSKQLRETQDEKLHTLDSFTKDQQDRLGRVLPDNVDNIHLVIDIKNIAARHGLTLKGVSFGTISDSTGARGALAVGASGSAVGSVELGFSVNASYDTMLSFLADLEHSLRILDVEKMSFTANPKDLSDYAFTIRTYWLH